MRIGIHAPSQHLVLAMELVDASIPFAEGTDLIVDIPVDPRGTKDVYIDDLIQANVIIDGTDNIIHCDQAMLLAIDTCTHPKHPNKPIPQEDMEARNKLQAEAGLEEQKSSWDGFWTYGISSSNYQRTSSWPGQI
jgi:hypothetical protein